jgi:hypothetical protein
MAAATASASPYGSDRKPGANGPKPSRVPASVENPTIVVVRPWKLPSNTRISALPSSTPLCRLPQRRAALIAVSTASAPAFIISTLS